MRVEPKQVYSELKRPQTFRGGQKLNLAGEVADGAFLIEGADAERPSSQGRIILSISISLLRCSGDNDNGFARTPSRSSANDPFSFLTRRRPGSSMVTISVLISGERAG